MIEITRREMERAYRDHFKAYRQIDGSSFSGLTCLFYAVECGLKSLIMEREQQETTEDLAKHDFSHNVNKMLSHLKCGKALHLPSVITLTDLKRPQKQRNSGQKELNQVWRYGVDIRDTHQKAEVVNKLLNVCHWIREQR